MEVGNLSGLEVMTEVVQASMGTVDENSANSGGINKERSRSSDDEDIID